MKTTVFLTLIITLLLTTCTKDEGGIINISGITTRDNVGNLLGGLDETDWTNDASFPDAVSSLLNFTETIDYSNAEISTIQIEAFPNPLESQFILNLSSSTGTVIKYIIVDEALKVYSEYALNLSAGNTLLAIQMNSSFPNNKYYRMYYAFYDKTKTIYFKGHGDLKKK